MAKVIEMTPNATTAQRLTPEELQSIRGNHDQVLRLKLNIGDLEYQKQGMMRQLDALLHSFRETEQALTDKYGKDAVIDINTGEVKQKE